MDQRLTMQLAPPREADPIRNRLDAAARIQRAFMDGRFAWLERAWSEIARQVPAAQQVDLAAATADAARRAVALIVSQSGLVLRDATLFVFNLIVALFATFFLSWSDRSSSPRRWRS